MELQVTLPSGTFAVHPEAIDLAIPLQFDGPQPNSYGVPAASSRAYEGGGFVGDVRRGGSCNFETYTFTPHCNGTHTEGVGHITGKRWAVHERLQTDFLPATVISVLPQTADTIDESYDPPLDARDEVISRQALEEALERTSPDFLDALVIRTLPNDRSKLQRDYLQSPAAFFSLEAMRYLGERNVQHLLVDLPSVDRLFDEGKLNAHHIFWGLAPGTSEVAAEPAPRSTITEFIFVPDAVADGHYLLNLQIAPFVSDAAPSRPRLYRLTMLG